MTDMSRLILLLIVCMSACICRSDDIFCRALNDFFLTPDCPFLEVRCDVEHVVTTRAPPPSGSTGGGTSGENNDRSDEHVQGNNVFGECGMRNPDGIAFKVANSKFNETEFGEFPWMVAVLQLHAAEETEVSTYVCGGSLIAPNVILTAAHCVMDKEAGQLTVRAGEWDTMTTNEIYPHQVSCNYFKCLQNFNRLIITGTQSIVDNSSSQFQSKAPFPRFGLTGGRRTIHCCRKRAACVFATARNELYQ